MRIDILKRQRRKILCPKIKLCGKRYSMYSHWEIWVARVHLGEYTNDKIESFLGEKNAVFESD